MANVLSFVFVCSLEKNNNHETIGILSGLLYKKKKIYNNVYVTTIVYYNICNIVVTILASIAVCCHMSLTVVALLQVVQSGGKNIELAVIRRNQPLKVIICIVNTYSISVLKLVVLTRILIFLADCRFWSPRKLRPWWLRSRKKRRKRQRRRSRRSPLEAELLVSALG